MNIKVIGGSLFAILLALLLVQSFHLTKPRQTSSLPFQSTQIVAPAMVDTFNDIMRIPTLQAGVLTSIPVKVGQHVKKGQTLFAIDHAMAQNEVAIQSIHLLQAQNKVELRDQQLMHTKAQLTRLQSLDQRAISSADLQEKRHEMDLRNIQLTEAKNEEALAEQHLKRGQLNLQQFSMAAPRDGVVLQINAHRHEAVSPGQIIVLLGDAQKVMVRVSLDERDAQRFDPQAKAYITSNEDPSLKIPLTFKQLDRVIITAERLNSRVQEALYFFKRTKHPTIIAGQQVDATIAVHSKAP